MKILFYSPVALRNGGGAERWQIAMAHELTALGHEVRVVSCDYGAAGLSSKELKMSLGKIFYRVLPTRFWGGVVWPSRRAVAELTTHFAWADRVHFVFGYVGHDLLMRRLSRLTKTPVVTGCHAQIITSSFIHNLYVATVSRFMTLPCLAAIMVFNEDERALLQKWGFNSFLISGMVDRQRFAPVPLPSGERTFICLGRLAPEKGIDILVGAIDQLFRRYPRLKARFLFVGDGEMRSLVTELAKRWPDRVTFIGFANDPRPYLKQAQVLVLPSKEETFGIAMLEALSMGRPVLAAAAAGPRRVISNHSGWLLPLPLTADRLAAALYKLSRLKLSQLVVFGQAAAAESAQYSQTAVGRRFATWLLSAKVKS